MADFLIVSSNADSGAGSLRQAITTANGNGTVDTITFVLEPIDSIIALTSGQLTITESVTIDGDLDDDGTPDITIDASGSSNSRVFTIDDSNNATFQEVTLNGLVVTGGRIFGDGSGIFSRENLILNNATISGNSTPTEGGNGGGIYSRYGILTLSNTTVSGNFTTGYYGDGGGIYSRDGTLTLNNSTVSGNSTSRRLSKGGGICSIDGTLTLNNSTVSGNATSGDISAGGGIYSINGTLTLNNATISGNAISGDGSHGGGIANHSGTLTLNNSTVSDNAAEGPRNYGGGIYSRSGTLALQSSIISGNRAATYGDDVAQSFTTVLANTNNLFGDSSKTRAEALLNFDPGANAIVATSDDTNIPLASILSPLADNGGPTLTHALPPGSPALDTGSNPLAFTTDQRGAGFIRESGDGPDIGAFERQGSFLFQDGFESSANPVAFSASVAPSLSLDLSHALLALLLVGAVLYRHRPGR